VPGDETPRRDVALDLLRGLAMVILVVNHIHLESALEVVTRGILSAAEVLVSVSGVVVGMVFGRRWRVEGPRAATSALLRRSRKLYVASLAVVTIVGVLTLVPGLATDVVTISPRAPDHDLYSFDRGPFRTLLAIATLEAGPWQFNILGFFIAALALAPAVLWALARGWWPLVLAASWALFATGRAWQVDVMLSQSEGPFPILVWQALFVHGLVIGWYRAPIGVFLRTWRAAIAGALVPFALALVYVRLVERWEPAHFDKTLLDPPRLTVMLSIAAALYLGLRQFEPLMERALGWLLLPLGRNSFYVFIVHVFLCLAVASVPALAGEGIGVVGNALVQAGCLALLVVMVRRRFLFRWVPR
jgi:hypothetical protein